MQAKLTVSSLKPSLHRLVQVTSSVGAERVEGGHNKLPVEGASRQQPLSLFGVTGVGVLYKHLMATHKFMDQCVDASDACVTPDVHWMRRSALSGDAGAFRHIKVRRKCFRGKGLFCHFFVYFTNKLLYSKKCLRDVCFATTCYYNAAAYMFSLIGNLVKMLFY